MTLVGRRVRQTTVLLGDRGQSTRRGKSWRSVNITPLERAGRIALGLAAVIAGIALLTGVGSAVGVILELLLIAAGVDLMVTGALGHCPLYQRLGYVPRSLRSPR